MKTRIPLLLIILAALAMLALSGCNGYSPVNGNVVMGGNYTLKNGETLNDDLTVLGGTAVLEKGTTINGDISVMGGTLDIDGTINGDVSVMGGAVNLGDNAVVHGSIRQIGGSTNRSPNARVDGTVERSEGPSVVVPPAPSAPSGPVVNLRPIFEPILAVFRALAIAALAVVVALFASRPMERVSESMQAQAVISGGIGLLSIFVVPALLLILALTLILIPVSLLGFLLLGIAMVFGWLAAGQFVGRQIAARANQNWGDPLTAGIGTLALTLASNLLGVIPCIGWIPGFLVGMVGLGSVIVTRFGTRSYNAGGPFPGSARPAYTPPAAQPPVGSYPAGETTTQYYAPHVVVPSTPPADLTAEPVPPVSVAPDLSFLNTDYGEKPAGEEGQPEDQKPDEPQI